MFFSFICLIRYPFPPSFRMPPNKKVASFSFLLSPPAGVVSSSASRIANILPPLVGGVVAPWTKCLAYVTASCLDRASFLENLLSPPQPLSSNQRVFLPLLFVYWAMASLSDRLFLVFCKDSRGKEHYLARETNSAFILFWRRRKKVL